MSTSQDELLYDYAEAARRLHVRKSWLETAVQKRLVPHTRMGRLVRFSETDLHEILLLNRQAPLPRRR